MGRETSIAWTQSTLNVAWGCTKVSEECRNCYMYRLSPRFGRDPYQVKILYKGMEDLSRKVSKLNNMIFVNSMSDTFHKDIWDALLDCWFGVFSAYKNKTFQILTKRPERAVQYFRTRKVPDNCWIGTSVGIKSALSRIELLKQIDAKIRFVSIEPLIEDLGVVDFTGIQWAIIGGESDFKAPRPMKMEWVANIFRQLRRDHVAIFFKQWGGIGGDGAGGNLLNGETIQEFPIIPELKERMSS